MKTYKHSFNDIRIDDNITLFDVDIDFYIDTNMELKVTIQDIGLILIDGVEYDSLENKTIFNKLEEYYRNNATPSVIGGWPYLRLLDIIDQERMAHAV